MKTTINFSAIEGVRLGTSDTAVVCGQDVLGAEANVIVKAVDVPKVANALLYYAAIANIGVGSGAKQLPGTIIPSGSLPVKSWQTGRSKIGHHLLLILQLHGGATLTFQFSAEDARDCGDALSTEGLGAALEL